MGESEARGKDRGAPELTGSEIGREEEVQVLEGKRWGCRKGRDVDGRHRGGGRE